MRLKKCLSGILALAMVLNTGATNVFAAGGTQTYAANTQTESEPETVYVNSYGLGERSVSFNDHWRFYLGDASGAEATAYNDSAWDNVTLPHDYSIDQGFTTAAPAEQESGYVLGGTGWYRKSFTLSEELEGKRISIDFDGVYMNATVYLNGVKLGTHPYGYSPFSFVLPSESLNFGGQENVLAVKVEHKQPSSRWYSGSGIYRDVKLTVTDPVHISYYGTQVTTPDIKEEKGTVDVVTTVQNNGESVASVSVLQTVYEKGSEEPVAVGGRTQAVSVEADGSADISSTVTVPEPKLWSTTSPNLYTVRTEVYVGDELADTYDTEFGFRWVEITKDNGFFLNGENIKLKGVCMHHDQGALGSEAWERSIERQVQLLKQMGINAIRVTHNPAAQVLIDICNREGIMLVEEVFDSWLSGKAGNTEDYGKWFDEPIEEGNQIVGGEEGEKWAEFDLKNTVLRGRNNPSIVMWSLGNEVFQQNNDTSRHGEYPDVARQLMRWTAEVDKTRYVTFGDNWFKGQEWGSGVATQTADAIASASDPEYGLPGGLPGYNYGSYNQIQNGHSKGWLVYGSETASSTNSRGVYDRKNSNSDGDVGDRRLTSYDKSCVSWGHRASDALWITMQQPFNVGEFVWTGFDYLGEPTPYNWQGTGSNGTWPNVSKNSYFGIIDTAGIPKDSYYLYQSQWNDQVNTLHVLPVWNEDEIMIDDNGNVEVVVYSDAPVVKLYLNGEEVGTATAERTDTPTGGYQNYTSGTGCFDSSLASGSTSLYATFWVPYEEGKLEAKAFEADGTTPITDTDGRSYVETTGNATKLEASADRDAITADGKDLSYITIDVTDTDGRFVNGAEPEITVSVSGDGKLLALDNGVQNDVTTYSEPTRKAGKGKLVAIVQSTEEAGSFTVTATAPGYATATETVTTTEAPDSGETTEKTVVSYTIARNYYVKQGAEPVLPEEVTVNYSDGTSETKKVSWDELPEEQDSYTLYGTLEDLDLRVSVNVTMIGEVADVLNYSAAIGQDADLVLPQMRPAVLADGTVLAAEFPVDWQIPEDATANLGTVTIEGTAQVFDQTFDVTASVRVTNGSYYEGDEALPNVPEMYIGGVSSKTDSSVAQVLNLLKDDKATKNDVAWSGRNTLDFRLDTAIDLQDFTLYLRDTAPTSDTIKVYASSNNGASWMPVDCTVSNQRGDGVTIRTYTPTETVSETWFRLEFTEQTTLVELEMNTRIPTFPVGSEAALSYLKVGGYIANSTALERGSYNVPALDLDVADITAEGKDNASVTILAKDSENVIRILLESEDHSQRGIFAVRLGKEDVASDDPNDASRDYPYADMTLRAPSVESGGSAAWANDNDSNTIWHTNWGGGTGPTDLTDDPENRYLEIELPAVTRVEGLRYLPRATDQNGIVTEYDIKVSTDGQDWTSVATGSWSTAVEWKLARFDSAAEAKYIRLYGVQTATNDGNPQRYMSAAEVRVCCASTGIYSGNTTVTLQEEDQSVAYTGREITPEPAVVYTNSDQQQITLQKDIDYTLSYENNVEPGQAKIIVEGKGNYSGIVEASFTILEKGEEVVESYEPVSVTTLKGQYPALPGTVVANTNFGERVMDVRWDPIESNLLKYRGTRTIQGTVVETNERMNAQVEVVDVVYFVDSGAETFTEDGQNLVDASEGVIKNNVPDQAYDEASGWGYTNPDTEVEVNGSGDAYETIRNFNSATTGKTLTYQFALEEGLYDVFLGFYDPWSEWAGDVRHAKITMVDDQEEELAAYEDHHISGNKDMVQLTDVNLSAAGNVRVNIAPLNTGENSDTMVSFIAIVRKDEETPIFRVDFESNGGSAVDSQDVALGQKAEEPQAPVRAGYVFEGWYQDEALEQPWDFEADAVTQNLTLYAKWSQVQKPVEKVTVTYTAGEGGRIQGTAVQTIDKGGSTTQVTAVANEGYTFSRWSDGVTTAQRTDTNVTASKTVTAEFTKNQTATDPGTPEPETPEARSVKLNVKKKISIGVKEKVQLKANVLPAGASQKVTWKSSKKSVVSVNANGKITGKKRGTAIITTTAENGKKVTCRVTVKKAPKKITLKSNVKAKTLKKGKSWTMKVKFPAQSASYKVTFKSNKKKVATVNANGKIKARKKGTAIITARTYNGKTVKVKIRVR